LRISSTTGLVLSGLGDILRAQWNLDIATHEAWTLDLEPRAKWVTCPGGKTCTHSTYDWEWNPDTGGEFVPTACMGHPYEIEVYLGTGSVQVRGKGMVQLRAVIEITDWDVGGRLYSVRVWARGQGFNLSGSFGILDTGGSYPNELDRKFPGHPPHSIAFWRQKETTT
jgi:hypothetical protein